MKTKSIVLGLMCIIHPFKGQNNFHKYYLEGQLSPGVQQGMPAVGTTGAFGFFMVQNASLDFRAGEIYNIRAKTVVGAIAISYKYHFKNGFFAGGGFAHHHELAEQDYVHEPAQAALGTHHLIMHRSGLCATAGYNFKPIRSTGFFSRVYPTANVLITWMTLDKGYNPLITANVGLRIGLKKI